MASSATVSLTWMTTLFEALPHYDLYGSRHAANAHETAFRLALGQLLQNMGQRLLDMVEARSAALGEGQYEIIDMLADDVGNCLKLLNRTGTIHLADEPDETIYELNSIDTKLMLLLEHLWGSSDKLITGDGLLFGDLAHDLAAYLQIFLELAEHRNSLLGLGWESEFGLKPGYSYGWEDEH